MDRFSERTLKRLTWIWSAVWVVSFFLSGWLFGTLPAVGVLVVGIAGTYAIERRRQQREDLDRRARIAEETRGPRRTGSAGLVWASTGPSIHDHILAHLPPPGRPLDEAGLRLPDEAPPDGETIRWAPGARDGMAVYHGFTDAEPEVVDRIFAHLVVPRSSHSDPPPVRVLEDAVTETGALPVVDPLVHRLHERAGTAHGPSVEALHDLGYVLATRSDRREAVKLGIAILGVVSHPADLAVLMTLGRHDEFTLYTAVAWNTTLDDPEPTLFELAQGVRGWGRIHLVSRLMYATDPVITDWIVRDGFRNDVMDEYLALIAARTGRLADRLAEEPDEALVDSARDIVVALINGGPVRGMPDYPDGPRALDLLLSLLAMRPLVPARLVATDVIERFLADEDGPWEGRDGWAASERAGLRARCTTIKERPGWRARIEADLVSTDAGIAATARQAARILGMDTFDAVLERVQAEPLGYDWYELLELTDEGRIDVVLELAASTLPLDTIASGPGRELGLGPGWEPHRALDWVLQGLARFPGRGWDLVRVGLASPVIRNRNMALRALDVWRQPAWPPDARPVLERTAAVEPDDRVREAIGRMLTGGPFAAPKDESPGRAGDATLG
jgi:hypothetical protein